LNDAWEKEQIKDSRLPELLGKTPVHRSSEDAVNLKAHPSTSGKVSPRGIQWEIVDGEKKKGELRVDYLRPVPREKKNGITICPKTKNQTTSFLKKKKKTGSFKTPTKKKTLYNL